MVISSHGEVSLGRAVKTLGKIDEDDQAVNALARAGDGKVYAATGPNGRIYRSRRHNQRVREDLRTGAVILSLVFDRMGGCSPARGGGEQARIYRIDGSGKATCSTNPRGPGTSGRWSAGPDGEIYAATGIEGQLIASSRWEERQGACQGQAQESALPGDGGQRHALRRHG